MNLLKSIFISIFMMSAMAGAGYSMWMLLDGGSSGAWGGALLATGPFVVVISWIMLSKQVARTSEHLSTLGVLGACGSLLAIWDSLAHNNTLVAPLIAIFGCIGFMAYSYWYSKFNRTPSLVLRVGKQLPSFKVRSTKGLMISSESFIGKPTVLIFYRGNWCPLCMSQIKELAGHYQALNDLGVRVALVSPQPHTNTINLAKKFGVNFDFLADIGNVAARTLGIDISHGVPAGMQMMGYDSDSVMPTVIITDSNGKILWTHETDNYRVRPEPETYFEVLRENGVVPQKSPAFSFAK